MSATNPCVYLAQQNKEVEVSLPPEVKKILKCLTKQNCSHLYASPHCGFHHASIGFGLCFLLKLAGEFMIAMVYAALFLRCS